MDEEDTTGENRTDTAMKAGKTPVPGFPDPFGRLEDGEVPERHEITGYVERPDPHRARGVTFDDMDLLLPMTASSDVSSRGSAGSSFTGGPEAGRCPPRHLRTLPVWTYFSTLR